MYHPSSMDRNVVICPTCNRESTGFIDCCHRDEGGRGDRRGKRDDDNDDDKGKVTDVDYIDGPSFRRDALERNRVRELLSLNKFLRVPATSNELKSKNGKCKVDRDRIHGTWEGAFRANLGSYEPIISSGR